MDVTSYLLGKNAGGGGGGSTTKTKPASISFASTSSVVSPEVIDVSIIVAFDYMFQNATQIEELDLSSWIPTVATTCVSMFEGCTNLKKIKTLDTSEMQNMSRMFFGCGSLEDVSQMDFSSIQSSGLYYMFRNCYSLTDDSVNNILASCITVPADFTGIKTLSNIGFRSSTVASSRIQALSNYQAFLDAGWTIGY